MKEREIETNRNEKCHGNKSYYFDLLEMRLVIVDRICGMFFLLWLDELLAIFPTNLNLEKFEIENLHSLQES